MRTDLGFDLLVVGSTARGSTVVLGAAACTEGWRGEAAGEEWCELLVDEEREEVAFGLRLLCLWRCLCRDTAGSSESEESSSSEELLEADEADTERRVGLGTGSRDALACR
jgi:hypothetical protein